MGFLRSRLEQWITGVWYADAEPPWILRQLERLYIRIQQRQKRQHLPLKPGELGVPVIVVGNITAGGTGKTPTVMALVAALKARGFHPGIVSRGYGRKRHDIHTVTTSDSYLDSGDEPLLLHRSTGVPVVVAKNRAAAAQRLLQDFPQTTHIIADDGLQHYRLKRDLEIIVLDAHRGLGNGHRLPAGPLREPRERLQEADFLVSMNQHGNQVDHYTLSVNNTFPFNALTGLSQNWDAFPNLVNIVLGVGNPQRILCQIQPFGIQYKAHLFPDHYRYQTQDLESITGPILTTEKDYLRFPKSSRSDIWLMPITAKLPDEMINAILQKTQDGAH